MNESIKKAIKAMRSFQEGTNGLYAGEFNEEIKALEEALKQQQVAPVAWMTINAYGEEDDIHYENPEGHLLEGWTYKPLYTHPPQAKQPSVKLRRGDILRCIETDELCTVWATSTTHKTLVKWSGNDFTDYTAEQIGELFWVEPKPEEPVGYFNANSDGKWEQSDSDDGVPFFAATSQQRKPLTEEQWQVIANTLHCCITRSQKNVIEDAIGIKE